MAASSWGRLVPQPEEESELETQALALKLQQENEQLQIMRDDISEWVNSALCLSVASEELFDALKTGAILVEMAQKIEADAAVRRSESSDARGKKNVHKNRALWKNTKRCVGDGKVNLKSFKNATPGSFFARDNTQRFLDWCRELGLPDVLLFESNDLVDGRNERKVLGTVLEVARLAAFAGVETTELVRMEMEVDAEADGDDEVFDSTVAVNESDFDMFSSADDEVKVATQDEKDHVSWTEDDLSARDILFADAMSDAIDPDTCDIAINIQLAEKYVDTGVVIPQLEYEIFNDHILVEFNQRFVFDSFEFASGPNTNVLNMKKAIFEYAFGNQWKKLRSSTQGSEEEVTIGPTVGNFNDVFSEKIRIWPLEFQNPLCFTLIANVDLLDSTVASVEYSSNAVPDNANWNFASFDKAPMMTVFFSQLTDLSYLVVDPGHDEYNRLQAVLFQVQYHKDEAWTNCVVENMEVPTNDSAEDYITYFSTALQHAFKASSRNVIGVRMCALDWSGNPVIRFEPFGVPSSTSVSDVSERVTPAASTGLDIAYQELMDRLRRNTHKITEYSAYLEDGEKTIETRGQVCQHMLDEADALWQGVTAPLLKMSSSSQEEQESFSNESFRSIQLLEDYLMNLVTTVQDVTIDLYKAANLVEHFAKSPHFVSNTQIRALQEVLDPSQNELVLAAVALRTETHKHALDKAIKVKALLESLIDEVNATSARIIARINDTRAAMAFYSKDSNDEKSEVDMVVHRPKLSSEEDSTSDFLFSVSAKKFRAKMKRLGNFALPFYGMMDLSHVTAKIDTSTPDGMHEIIRRKKAKLRKYSETTESRPGSLKRPAHAAINKPLDVSNVTSRINTNLSTSARQSYRKGSKDALVLKSDLIHQSLLETLKELPKPAIIKYKRIAHGKYRFVGVDHLTYIRQAKHRVIVREGAGWDSLKNWLGKLYDKLVDKNELPKTPSSEEVSTSSKLSKKRFSSASAPSLVPSSPATPAERPSPLKSVQAPSNSEQSDQRHRPVVAPKPTLSQKRTDDSEPVVSSDKLSSFATPPSSSEIRIKQNQPLSKLPLEASRKSLKTSARLSKLPTRDPEFVSRRLSLDDKRVKTEQKSSRTSLSPNIKLQAGRVRPKATVSISTQQSKSALPHGEASKKPSPKSTSKPNSVPKSTLTSSIKKPNPVPTSAAHNGVQKSPTRKSTDAANGKAESKLSESGTFKSNSAKSSRSVKDLRTKKSPSGSKAKINDQEQA